MHRTQDGRDADGERLSCVLVILSPFDNDIGRSLEATLQKAVKIRLSRWRDCEGISEHSHTNPNVCAAGPGSHSMHRRTLPLCTHDQDTTAPTIDFKVGLVFLSQSYKAAAKR